MTEPRTPGTRTPEPRVPDPDDCLSLSDAKPSGSGQARETETGQAGERAGRTEHREAFWTLVVGIPAALSVLRLWVEAGGELQTTLLLVSNVSPLNLTAALFATVTQLVTVVLIALFTAGGILGVSMWASPPGSRLRTHPPLAVRLHAATPPWFLAATFGLAVLTWKIFYLPLLLPALAATFQRAPWELHDRKRVAIPACAVALVAYAWLVGDAVWDAWRGGEVVIAVLLVAPPLVAFLVTGPTPERFARTFAVVSTLAVIALGALVARSSVQTPILPLVATEVSSADSTEIVRGHIIDVNDLYLIMLEEHGGIRYIPSEDVGETVLCGTPEEVPAFGTRVRDFHVEDSLLTATGRHIRPRVRIDPLCRIVPDARYSGQRS